MYEIERRFLFNKKMVNLIENFYATSGGICSAIWDEERTK